VTEADVEAMVVDGRIVRTHILRPTWHYVLPADFRWMMALSGPRVESKIRPRYAELGLDDGLLQNATALIVDALSGGRRMTRSQIGAMLGEARIEVQQGRLAYVVTHCELNQVICSGGLSGKQQTYALVDERVPQAEPVSRDGAVAELTRRYFVSHGPSAIADFTWWSGLTVRDARQGLQAVASDLEQLTLDGTAYWFSPTAASEADGGSSAGAGAAPAAQLLQTFDEYIVGYQATRSAIDAAGLTGPGTWNPNSFVHPIVIDGQMAGGWRRELKNDRAVIRVKLFRDLDLRERSAFDEAIHRYGDFLGLPTAVEVAA
jgi:hypothetical protein